MKSVIKKLAVAASAFIALVLSVGIVPAGITGVKAADTAVNTECYNSSAPLALAPAVVTNVRSSADLVALKRDERAAVAVMTVNEDMYVLKADGTSMGVKPADVYDDYFNGRVIPGFYVKDIAVAERAAEYMTNSCDLTDMEIISASPEVLEYFKTNKPQVRRIKDCSSSVVTAENIDELIFDANRAGAHALILSSENATLGNVRYIQARNVTVWATADNDTDIYKALQSGAYGIVSYSAAKTYEAFSAAAGGELLVNRAPYNVAHRGLAATNYENSIEAFDAAYKAGATHVELDLQLTKDNKIVIMHAENINSVTNGSGKVTDYTLDELKQFRIIKNCKNQVLGEGVPIPTLEEVFDYFKDTDLLFLVEVKSGSASFTTYFKEVLEKYDFRNRIVMISFNEAQLKILRKELPEVSCCSLNDLTVANFFDKLPAMSEFGYTFDVTYGNAAGGKLYRMLRDRGYMVWTWTYGYYSDIVAGIKSGSTGLTNDAADSIGDFAVEAYSDKKYFVVNSFNDSVNFGLISYNKKTEQSATGVPVFVSKAENENQAEVVYAVKFTVADGTNYRLLTKPYRCVKSSAYVSAEQMNAILSKKAGELTKEEISVLNKMQDAYELLSDDEKALVDYDKIIELKRQADELGKDSSGSQTSGGSDNSSDRTGGGCGCNSSASSASILAGFALLSVLLLIKKKVFN